MLEGHPEVLADEQMQGGQGLKIPLFRGCIHGRGQEHVDFLQIGVKQGQRGPPLDGLNQDPAQLRGEISSRFPGAGLDIFKNAVVEFDG